MKDLKKISDTDLNKKLDEKRKALLDLRFTMSGTAKRNDKGLQKLRREIAQIMTEQKLRNTAK